MRSAEKNVRKAGMQGFTLVELLVVIAIVAILTVTAAVSFTSPSRKLKNAVFILRNDLNLARSEAVNRGKNVYVDFLDAGGALDDGYQIWADMDGSGAYTAAADGAYIKQATFPDGIQYYDTTVSGGPVSVSGGITFVGDSFFMKADGTPGTAATGTVYLYVTEPGNHTIRRAYPMSIIVSPNTGRVRVEFWNSTSASWQTK